MSKVFVEADQLPICNWRQRSPVTAEIVRIGQMCRDLFCGPSWPRVTYYLFDNGESGYSNNVMGIVKKGAAWGIGFLFAMPAAIGAPLLYGVDLISNRLVQIDRTSAAVTLGPFLTQGSPGGASPFNGLAYDPTVNRLLAINPSTSRIHSIDPETGVTSTVGPTNSLGNVNANGIAIEPVTRNLFVSTNNTNRLLTLSRLNGTVLSSVPITGANEVEGLAIDPATGTLFGISQLDLRVFKINVSTGVATPLPTALPSGVWRGLEFDFQTSQLLASTSGASSALYRINPVTGISSPVGILTGVSVQGLAITPEPTSISLLCATMIASCRRRRATRP